MLNFTGRLRINMAESYLGETKLALEGAADPFGDATDFLRAKPLRTGDPVRVLGKNGRLGNATVIFMVDAERLSDSALAEDFVSRALASPLADFVPDTTELIAAAAGGSLPEKPAAKPKAKAASKPKSSAKAAGARSAGGKGSASSRKGQK